jgi:hypothetical protein
MKSLGGGAGAPCVCGGVTICAACSRSRWLRASCPSERALTAPGAGAGAPVDVNGPSKAAAVFAAFSRSRLAR